MMMMDNDIKAGLFDINNIVKDKGCPSPAQCQLIIEDIKSNWDIFQTIRFELAGYVEEYPKLELEDFIKFAAKVDTENTLTQEHYESLFKKASKEQPMGRG